MSLMAGTSHRLGRWWLIGGLMVVGALAGVAYGLLRPPVYEAKAYVVAVSSESGGGSAAVSYAQAYARIADQEEVFASAADYGKAAPDELRRSVRASSSPDAPIIEITGSGRPASRSAELANMVANGLIDSANRTSVDTRVRLVLVSAAAPPATPSSPEPLLDVAVGVAAGLLLGGLVLLGRFGWRIETGDPAYEPSGAAVEPNPRRAARRGPSIPTPRTGEADGAVPDTDGWSSNMDGRRPDSGDWSSDGVSAYNVYRSANARRADTADDAYDDPDMTGETTMADQAGKATGAGPIRRTRSRKPSAKRSARRNAARRRNAG